MKKKQISIIVPIYNSERYLKRCLDSIINQSYKDIEIILVNDGSTDDSLFICKSYQKIDNRVKIIDKLNEGLVRARKTGINVSEGELIAFVDSDDWIDENFIEILMKQLEKNNADIVCSGAIAEKNYGVEYWYGSIAEGVYFGENINELYNNMLSTSSFYNFGILPNVWNKLFKKQILVKIYEHVNDNITYGEDAAAVYPALLEAKKVVVIREAYYHYCIREDSMSFDKGKKLYDSLYYLFNTLKYFFEKSAYSSGLMEQLKRYIIFMDMHNMRNVYGINLIFAKNKTEFLEAKGKKVVIYGAGKEGQRLFFELNRKNEMDIVLWVDENYKNLQHKFKGLVLSPKEIWNYKYDYIIIGIKNNDTADCVRKQLVSMGIKNESILWKPMIYDIEADWI